MALANNNNYLLDTDFLAALDKENQRELYVKIIALTLDEDPVDEIEGRATTGSISVDGGSKLRRSCSITLISERLDVNEYLWGLNTKIKVFVGMKNTIDKRYPDIIWFKQGTFILTSFNINIQNSASTISLQGKDKMCLCDGSVGGSLTALSYKFDSMEVVNSYNSIYKEKLTLERIIREAVRTYAKEPYHNIIINDLDEWGLELLTYHGEEPIYFLYNVDTTDIDNMTLNKNQEYFEEDGVTPHTIEAFAAMEGFEFKTLNELNTESMDTATKVYANNKCYQIIKVENGQTCGYRFTDLTFPKELIINVGEALTSMLDKLVEMLGNFEYFYNIDGQFVFQKKRTYVSTSWNNLINNGEEQWADNAAYTSAHMYSLYDSHLVSSYQNQPKLDNVKNDFSIWGTKKTATDQEIPIHLRYAIDKKPSYYTNYNGNITYTTRSAEEYQLDKDNGVISAAPAELDPTLQWELKPQLDWRELIYQMAIDFNQNHDEESFMAKIRENNPITCPIGYTGYEQYYIDMEGFWRLLYNPDYKESYDVVHLTRSEYDNIVKRGGYYYDAPVYKQCTDQDIYYNEVQYYTCVDGNYSLAIITEAEFNKNKTVYYFIPKTEIKPLELATRTSDAGYYDTQSRPVSGTPEDLTEYFVKTTKEYKDNRIFKLEPYNAAILYNEKIGEKYQSASITRAEYELNPWKYYRNNNGKQVCCTSLVRPKDLTITAFLDSKGNITSYTAEEVRSMTDASLEEKSRAGDIWYYNYTRDFYEPCIYPVLPYDSNMNYYVVSDLKEFNGADHPALPYWKSTLIAEPEGLIFWIDFLDTDGELSNYSAHNIGDRPKAVNDKDVKAIYYRETPSVIFLDPGDWDDGQKTTGYTYAQLPKYLESLFTISTQGKSAKDVLDDYLYKYSYCTENVNITTLPIYHLEPNVRVLVHDDKSHIDGEYIVNKFTVPLDIKGTMSISAVKAVDRLY